MKQLVLFITIVVIAVSSAEAKNKKPLKNAKAVVKVATKNKVTKKGSSDSKEGQLGTAFSFDAASVRGKYQMAGQGIASVEDEKVLDDLLGLRRSFNDREAQESTRW